MQVFGLPGHLIRNARRASRLIDAKTPNIAAAIRGDVLARWRRAMANGLTAQQAADVGVPRSTLYRWERTPAPKSRRPHRPRKPAWCSALVKAVEELRADNAMWGAWTILSQADRSGLFNSMSNGSRNRP